ncbi:MAG TPA: histidine phosphatase family protein, partial [Acidimicrobiales bacterium]|nr:histidine phosphatase family protein [Acidimicrobiales bacterium]
MRLILVRHGRAGRRDDWHGPDKLRPLEARGRRQAERLVGVLAPLGPVRIVSSPYRRCLETVGPVAAHLGLEVEQT